MKRSLICCLARSPPPNTVRSPGASRCPPSPLSSQLRADHPESSNTAAARGGQVKESLPAVTGSAYDEGAEWRRMQAPGMQNDDEDTLFQNPLTSEEGGAQQTHHSTEGTVGTLAGYTQPPDMETEEQRTERGHIAREKISARQVANLGEDAENGRRLRLLRDEAIETRALIEVSVRAARSKIDWLTRMRFHPKPKNGRASLKTPKTKMPTV